MNRIADAIDRNFTSPNVSDSNWEAANIVDVIHMLSRSILLLGNNNASTSMGGLEAHGKAMLDSAQTIADAIHDLADAIRETRTTR